MESLGGKCCESLRAPMLDQQQFARTLSSVPSGVDTHFPPNFDSHRPAWVKDVLWVTVWDDMVREGDAVGLGLQLVVGVSDTELQVTEGLREAERLRVMGTVADGELLPEGENVGLGVGVTVRLGEWEQVGVRHVVHDGEWETEWLGVWEMEKEWVPEDEGEGDAEKVGLGDKENVGEGERVAVQESVRLPENLTDLVGEVEQDRVVETDPVLLVVREGTGVGDTVLEDEEVYVLEGLRELLGDVLGDTLQVGVGDKEWDGDGDRLNVSLSVCGAVGVEVPVDDLVLVREGDRDVEDESEGEGTEVGEWVVLPDTEYVPVNGTVPDGEWLVVLEELWLVVRGQVGLSLWVRLGLGVEVTVGEEEKERVGVAWMVWVGVELTLAVREWVDRVVETDWLRLPDRLLVCMAVGEVVWVGLRDQLPVADLDKVGDGESVPEGLRDPLGVNDRDVEEVGVTVGDWLWDGVEERVGVMVQTVLAVGLPDQE